MDSGPSVTSFPVIYSSDSSQPTSSPETSAPSFPTETTAPTDTSIPFPTAFPDTTTTSYDPLKRYDPNGDRSFNQFTRTHYDVCNYENQLRLGARPIKYVVNQYNNPQVNPFMMYTEIGNQKTYNVENMYDRALPTRLNPLNEVYVFPYSTTPFLGALNASREYSDTESNLRYGTYLRDKKSAVDIGQVDYARWDPGVSDVTVQNAGQFGNGKMQQPIGKDGFFDYSSQNNVLFMNSAVPFGGISSRNQLHNFVATNNC